jgi:hypothetical protein
LPQIRHAGDGAYVLKSKLCWFRLGGRRLIGRHGRALIWIITYASLGPAPDDVTATARLKVLGRILETNRVAIRRASAI